MAEPIRVEEKISKSGRVYRHYIYLCEECNCEVEKSRKSAGRFRMLCHSCRKRNEKEKSKEYQLRRDQEIFDKGYKVGVIRCIEIVRDGCYRDVDMLIGFLEGLTGDQNE